MIAVDTNILVYAHRADIAQHARALQALRSLAQGDEPWGFPVFVMGEFLRVVTHPRLFKPPSTRMAATEAVSGLLASPTVRVLFPGPRFWPLLQHAMKDADARGNLVLDALIVAVCREHGVRRILTEDKDFRRFSGITPESLPAN